MNYFEMVNGPLFLRGSGLPLATANSVNIDVCYSECVKYNNLGEHCLAFNYDSNNSSNRNCYLILYSDLSELPEIPYPSSTYRTYFLKSESSSTSVSNSNIQPWVYLIIGLSFAYLIIVKKH